MQSNKMKIEVCSEVDNLKGVILHRPGAEVEKMTPQNIAPTLYSDILNLSIVNEEYKHFSGVLEKVTKVFYLTDLLAETLTEASVRNKLLARIITENVSSETKNVIRDLSPEELAKILVEGYEVKNTLSNYLSSEAYAFTPLYNFFFMRDASSSVFNNVLINSMASEVRRPEAFIMETIFNHSQHLETTTLNPINSNMYSEKLFMEGGDILVAREDVLLIGTGLRTSSQGIDYIAQSIDTEGKTKTIIVQELPHEPESFIHLDMVFTLLSHEECMVYEPLILKSNQYKTIKMTVRDSRIIKIEEQDNLLSALSSLKIDLKPVLCGGKERMRQDREQWHSGANFFAFAPGKVIGYARNTYTVEAMNQAGFEIVSSADVISGKVNPNDLKKVLVTIPGSELARGGGGARCMTMPVRREK